MKTFSIPQLSTLISGLGYVTQHSFIACFRTMYGHTPEEAQRYWSLSKDIMRCLYEEKQLEDLEYLLDKLPAVIERIRTAPDSPYRYNLDRDAHNHTIKVVYKEHEATQELIVDFNDPLEILNCADLLHRKIEIIAMLQYVEEISKCEMTMQVFNGDFFITLEREFRNDKSEVYLLHEGIYRKLLYTESRGYMINGEPVMGDAKYNSHVLTCATKFERRGNIHVDYSYLVENAEK